MFINILRLLVFNDATNKNMAKRLQKSYPLFINILRLLVFNDATNKNMAKRLQKSVFILYFK
ncbi:hypothetical protein DXA58_19595 [Bacteroides uniformis]|nr:hypothetical protein DXA58_19595 [Bacteroides uniformis]